MKHHLNKFWHISFTARGRHQYLGHCSRLKEPSNTDRIHRTMKHSRSCISVYKLTEHRQQRLEGLITSGFNLLVLNVPLHTEIKLQQHHWSACSMIYLEYELWYHKKLHGVEMTNNFYFILYNTMHVIISSSSVQDQYLGEKFLSTNHSSPLPFFRSWYFEEEEEKRKQFHCQIITIFDNK